MSQILQNTILWLIRIRRNCGCVVDNYLNIHPDITPVHLIVHGRQAHQFLVTNVVSAIMLVRNAARIHFSPCFCFGRLSSHSDASPSEAYTICTTSTLKPIPSQSQPHLIQLGIIAYLRILLSYHQGSIAARIKRPPPRSLQQPHRQASQQCKAPQQIAFD